MEGLLVVTLADKVPSHRKYFELNATFELKNRSFFKLKKLKQYFGMWDLT